MAYDPKVKEFLCISNTPNNLLEGIMAEGAPEQPNVEDSAAVHNPKFCFGFGFREVLG